jgi:hypothetical protein
MLKVCGRLKGLIPYKGLIFPQSRESAEVRAQSYSSGAYRPCFATAITLRYFGYILNLACGSYLYGHDPDSFEIEVIILESLTREQEELKA